MSEDGKRALDLEIAKLLFDFAWYRCVALNGVQRYQFLSPKNVEIWRKLGWQVNVVEKPKLDLVNDDTMARAYSRAYGDMMKVIEALRERFWNVKISDDHDVAAIWEVEFRRDDRCYHAYSDSLPEAVLLGGACSSDSASLV